MKDTIEKNRFNHCKNFLKEKIFKLKNILSDIKIFNDKFKEESQDNVCIKLSKKISNILNNFKKSYSDFMEKGFETEVDDIKNDMSNRFNMLNLNKKNEENILKDYEDSKNFAKEEYKYAILTKIFIEKIKEEYENYINKFLLENHQNPLNNYGELTFAKMYNINKEYENVQNKYKIYIYFPKKFINSNNNFYSLISFLKDNTKTIFTNAVANTIKELREAARLNIMLGFKDKKIYGSFENKICYKLNRSDLKEIYNELKNLTTKDNCYKRLVDFKNTLYTINFGEIDEKNNFRTTFSEHQIIFKNLYDTNV